MIRRAGLAAGLAGGVLFMGGCVEFDGTPKGEQISNDKVRIKFTICDDNVPDCNPEAEAANAAARGPAEESSVLLAFRVPKGTNLPSDFQPRDLDVDFTESGSYTNQMNAKAPRKDSEKWYGYRSENIEGNPATEAKFKLVFELPKDPGNSFKYRPVAGYVDGATETVACAENPRDTFEGESHTVVCVDDPETAKELNKSLEIKLD